MIFVQKDQWNTVALVHVCERLFVFTAYKRLVFLVDRPAQEP